MKDWLASIEKGLLIYDLSEKETVYLTFNAAERPVSKFIGDKPGEGSSVDLDRIGRVTDR